MSRSSDFFGRPDPTSSIARPRYMAKAKVPGIGKDRMSAGYVEMLKDSLGRYKTTLVRLPSMSPVWHLNRRGRDLAHDLLKWTANGNDLRWTAGSDDLVWRESGPLYAEPATDEGWPAARLTNMPPGVTIAPSEFITVRGRRAETGRALAPATSDNAGVAIVRLEAPITVTGTAEVGEHPGMVFQVLEVPRAVQPLYGDWAFDWSFRQVFEDEVPGGFQDLDPWRRRPTVPTPDPTPDPIGPVTFASTSVTWGSTSVTWGG